MMALSVDSWMVVVEICIVWVHSNQIKKKFFLLVSILIFGFCDVWKLEKNALGRLQVVVGGYLPVLE